MKAKGACSVILFGSILLSACRASSSGGSTDTGAGDGLPGPVEDGAPTDASRVGDANPMGRADAAADADALREDGARTDLAQDRTGDTPRTGVADTPPREDAPPTADTNPGPRDAAASDDLLAFEVASSDTSRDGGQPEAAGPGPVSVVANSVLSSNATTVKSYDTNVNVSSFRQHGILYYAGYQFVAWFNGNARNAIVARRTFDVATLAAGAWSWAYVNFTLVSDGDSHNVIVMGVSPLDGRLHVAFGQHGAQLYTLRSAANAIGAVTWDNTVFGGTGTTATGAASPSTGLPGYGAATGDVTYPYFISVPDAGQTLQLAYRTGSSGDGEMQLAEYDAASGKWSYVGQFTSATGSYTQNGVTSTSRNAYPHGFNYDSSGRLHMAFTFRENLSTAFIANCGDTINNHDTLYIYSDDRGRTWLNNAGAVVADVKAGKSAGIGSPGLVIDALPVGRDMMNQETQVTDHHDNLHVIVSYVPDPYQPGCATDRTQAQPFHLWRDSTGAWTKTQIRLGGKDVNQGYDRTKVFVDASDNLYVLMPDLRLVAASVASRWTDWKLLWDGGNLGNYGEAIIDYNLTRIAPSVSVLYMKDTNSATGELHVLDLRIGP